MKSFLNKWIVLLGIVFVSVQGGMGAPGGLDTSFGTEGKVVTVLPNDSQGECVVVQPDGKILVGGVGHVSDAINGVTGHFVFVARYTAQGILDEDFGDGGTAKLNSDRDPWIFSNTSSILLQSDGKIIALAQFDSKLGLVRFHANGQKDLEYGNQGLVIRELPGPTIASAKIANDNKVIVSGNVSGPSGFAHFFVARFTADGILDTEFGADGIVTFTEEGGYYVNDIAIQDDRKIVVAGGANYAGTLNGVSLIRFDAQGGLDSSFSQNGYLTHAFSTNGDYANKILVQPNGKLLLVGDWHPVLTEGSPFDSRSFLARFESNGDFDEGFGDGGFRDLKEGEERVFAVDFHLQTDGRIVVRRQYNDNHYLFRRYHEDGVSDPDYGTNGSIMISPAWGSYLADTYPRSTLMPDGRMVFVAYELYYEASTAHTSVALWCYQGDELRMLRPVSDGKGKFSFRVKGPFDAAFDIEWTEDFCGWNKAGSGNLSNSYFDFQEIVSGPAKRFYRITRKD